MACSAVRPSLEKIALTCFSTEDSDSVRRTAMPAFPRPCAISRNTSSSRAVNFASGDSYRVTTAYADINNTYDPGGRIGQLVFRVNW